MEAGELFQLCAVSYAEYVLCKTGLGAFDAKALRGGRIAP
jgi:hypothetical protein